MQIELSIHKNSYVHIEQCPLSEVVCFSEVLNTVNLIGALMVVHFMEVVSFWEGLLRAQVCLLFRDSTVLHTLPTCLHITITLPTLFIKITTLMIIMLNTLLSRVSSTGGCRGEASPPPQINQLLPRLLPLVTTGCYI